MRNKFLWILAGFAFFIFCFIWRFPYGNLQGTISELLMKNAGISLVSKDVSPALLGWPGISFEGVDASIPVGADNYRVKADSVTIRAGIAGFFPFGPRISAYVQGLEKGGQIYVKFRDRKTAYGLQVDAADVDLVQFKSDGGAPIRGKLFSDLDVYYDTAELNRSKGNVDISIQDVITPAQNIPGYLSTPELKLGTFVAKMSIVDGVAKFEDVRFGGGTSDLSGSISGQIKLGKSYLDSNLDVVLKIQASEAFAKSPESNSLLAYLSSFKCAASPNAYGLKWNKTFGQMMRNAFDAFPAKAPC